MKEFPFRRALKSLFCDNLSLSRVDRVCFLAFLYQLVGYSLGFSTKKLEKILNDNLEDGKVMITNKRSDVGKTIENILHFEEDDDINLLMENINKNVHFVYEDKAPVFIRHSSLLDGYLEEYDDTTDYNLTLDVLDKVLWKSLDELGRKGLESTAVVSAIEMFKNIIKNDDAFKMEYIIDTSRGLLHKIGKENKGLYLAYYYMLIASDYESYFGERMESLNFSLSNRLLMRSSVRNLFKHYAPASILEYRILKNRKFVVEFNKALSSSFLTIRIEYGSSIVEKKVNKEIIGPSIEDVSVKVDGIRVRISHPEKISSLFKGFLKLKECHEEVHNYLCSDEFLKDLEDNQIKTVESSLEEMAKEIEKLKEAYYGVPRSLS